MASQRETARLAHPMGLNRVRRSLGSVSPPRAAGTAWAELPKIRVLLSAVPIAFLVQGANLEPWRVFLVAGIAIVPLAALITDATGAIAGQAVGGPLNATFGNVPDLTHAVRFDRRDHLDLSSGITLGGGTHLALRAAPLLVFFGLAIDRYMNLLFSKFEIVAIIFTVTAVIKVLHTGAVRWIAGGFLLLSDVMFGFGFFHVPPIPVPTP